MSTELLTNSMPKWNQVELTFPKDYYNQLILRCLAKILSPSGETNRGYFNREGDGKKQKLRLHVNSSETKLLDLVKSELEKGNFPIEEIKPYNIIYNVDQDIADLISGASAQQVYIDYSVSSMPFIFEWISNFEDKKLSKLTFAFDLMVMHMLNDKTRAVYEMSNQLGKYPASFLCYRSHADGFLIRTKYEDKVRQEMEMQYQAQKNIFQKRFRMLEEQYYTGTLDSKLSSWVTLVKDKLAIIENEILLNKISFVNFFVGEMGDSYDISNENIHSKMQENKLIQSYVSQDLNFQVIRLMTGLLYLTLHRLGLSLSERYYLCYAISRSIEDIFSIGSEQALKEMRRKLQKRRIKKIFTLGLSA